MAILLMAGIIPAVFVVSFGRAWRPVASEPRGFPTWAGFLAIAQFILIGIMLLVTQVSKDFGSVIAMLILPAICAMLAESLLYVLKAFCGLVLRREATYLRWPAALLMIVPPMLGALGWLSDPYYVTLIAYAGGLLAFTWLDWEHLGNRQALLYVLLVLFLLAAVWREDTRNPLLFQPPAIAHLANFLITTSIGLGCTVPFRILGDWLKDEGFLDFRRLLKLILLVTPFLALEGWLAATLSTWDVATDGLGSVFMGEIAVVLEISAASLLAWRMAEKRLSAVYAASFVLPVILVIASNLGTYGPTREWGQAPHIRTERRAALIEQAIQRYHQDRGNYPQALSELTPSYLIYLPTPFIIPGQNWCYQGGKDYYRLGYINRELFSTPTSVEVYSIAGQPPDSNWNCVLINP